MRVAIFLLIVVTSALSEQHQKPTERIYKRQTGNVIIGSYRFRIGDGTGFLIHYYKERPGKREALPSSSIILPPGFLRHLEVAPKPKLQIDHYKPSLEAPSSEKPSSLKVNIQAHNQLHYLPLEGSPGRFVRENHGHHHPGPVTHALQDEFDVLKELGVLFEGVPDHGTIVHHDVDENAAMEDECEHGPFFCYDEEDGFYHVPKYDSEGTDPGVLVKQISHDFVKAYKRAYEKLVREGFLAPKEKHSSFKVKKEVHVHGPKDLSAKVNLHFSHGNSKGRGHDGGIHHGHGVVKHHHEDRHGRSSRHVGGVNWDRRNGHILAVLGE